MQGAEKFVGKWRLDTARSEFQYGIVPRKGELLIEPLAVGLRIRLEMEGARGTPIVVDGVWGEGETPKRTLKVADERTIHQTAIAASGTKTTTRRELSENGDTQTVIDEGAEPDGEPWRNTWVFARIWD
ncbi:MAG: hypothetical protein WBV82_30905 [Myxococcaceae bacterium]